MSTLPWEETPERFPSTQWSLVARAGEENAERRREALNSLLMRYLPALRTHLIRGKGMAADKADDILQEFIARKVLERDLIAQADRQVGKFRTFLLTAMNRFLLNLIREEQAKKRSPGYRPASLDNAEECPGTVGEPSRAFDVAWARSIIEQGLQRMQMECKATERADVWGVFECRVVGPMLEGTPIVDYQELVNRFGFRSPAQATNILVTGKRMYARALRLVVAEYCRGGDEVESELMELREIVSNCGRG
jgi:DNA-directed RNA polymerase specialized sigma24 family protein